MGRHSAGKPSPPVCGGNLQLRDRLGRAHFQGPAHLIAGSIPIFLRPRGPHLASPTAVGEGQTRTPPAPKNPIRTSLCAVL